MKKIKIKNGFSLLEIVLGLGLIGLASAAIYSNYNSKRNNANIDRQAILLQDLSQRAIRAFSASPEPATAATTQNLIDMRAVPVDAFDSAQGVITNVFGGIITVSGTNHLSNPANVLNPVPVTEEQAGTIILTLNNVPDYACTKLGTSSYADGSYSFSVNGINIKNPGEQPDAVQVSALAQNCVMGNNNVMAFSHSLFQPDLLDFRVTGNDANRGKEDPKNIADIGRTTVAAAACTGGAVWNAESSHCMCSSSSFWNGQQCIAYNSDIGNCEPGYGWNGNRCVPHTKVGEVGSHVEIKNHEFDMPVGSSVPNPGIVIENGRRILRVGYPQEIINNWQVNSVLPSGNFTKHQCDATVSSDPAKVGHWNGYTCTYCTNGSTWNDTLKRCVTTGVSANN